MNQKFARAVRQDGFTHSWTLGGIQSGGARRRLANILRKACMVLGFSRRRRGPGLLGYGMRAGVAVTAGCAMLGITAQPGHAAVAGVCTGVSLPRSVVTDIAGDVLAPIVAPIETTLSILTLGTVDLNLSGALTSAAAGAPITLQALDINGNGIDVLSDPTCDATADSYQLETQKGISLGGNRITGLGTTGLEANAGELNAIAIGDNASTAVGASAAIAIGENASATHSGSVALGSGSSATGATLANQAYAVGGTALAEVNVGDRRITGLAAGAMDTDAVNVAQLKAAQTGLVNIFGGGATVNVDGSISAPTYTIHNAGSTTVTTDYNDVGSALAALDNGVTNNTTAITNLTNGTAGLVQQVGGSTAPITVGAATGGTSVNFAGTDGDRTLSGVADGVANNDAATVGQLSALADNAVQYDDATKAAVTLGGATGTTITNLAAGAVNSTSTDAINGSQLYNSALSVAGALGGSTVVNVDGSISAPTYTIHNAGSTTVTTDYNDVGSALAALDNGVTNNTTSIGNLNTSITNLTTNINNGTIGLVQQVGGSTSPITVGATTGGSSVNFAGTDGDRTLSGVADGVANNDAATVGQLNALADNAVQYDDATKAAVTLGGATGTTITNLAAGAVNSTSTDAINGSQLYNSALSVAGALGGSTVVNVDGSISAPTYTIHNAGSTTVTTDYNDVGSALTALDNGVTNNTTSIANLTTNISNGTIGLVQQVGGPTAPITVGAATGGTSVNFAGTDGDRKLSGVADAMVDTDAVNLRQLNSVAAVANNSVQYDDASKGVVTLGGATGTTITNLTAGAVNSTSTDAVNGSQLYAVQQQVDQNTTNIANIDNRITNVEGNLTTLNTQVANITNGTAGLVQQVGGAPGSGDITVGAQTGGTTVNLAGTDGDRRLTGLAAGEVSATSTDAVTGAQLYAAQVGNVQTLTTINNLANGTEGYLQVNNTAAAPKPSASGTNSLAAGAGAVSSGANSTALGMGAVASADNSVAVGNGSVASFANTVSVGAVGAERAITNVANGVRMTDAVNLGQMNAGLNNVLDMARSYTDERISQLGFDLSDLRRDGEAATASAMAVAGIPQVIEPGSGMVGMGVATWQGENAVAFGLSKASDNGRIVVRAGATMNTQGQGGANAGVGLAF